MSRAMNSTSRGASRPTASPCSRAYAMPARRSSIDSSGGVRRRDAERAGFGIGTSTAWRYVRQAVDLLAALADDLSTAVGRAARLVYAILDGTLIPMDRVADQKPYYSGKHRRHGVNVRVLADPAPFLARAQEA